MKKNYKNPVAHAIVALITVCATFSYGQTVDPGFLSPLVLRQANTVAISKALGKKVYLAGDIDFHGTTRVRQVVRIHSDGSLDALFNANLPEYNNAAVRALDVLPNGKVVVVMQGQVSGSIGVYLLDKYGKLLMEPRYDIEGGADCVRALPDNTFLLGGGGSVERYDENLQHLGRFCYVSGGVNDIEVEGSKIIISGAFTYVFDPVRQIIVDRNNIARLNMDATIDQTFNADAAVASYGDIGGISVQPDQKIILEKKYNSFNSSEIISMRLNADGSPDTQFNSNYPSTVTIEEAHYRNGKITIVTKFNIARLNLDGTFDPTFKPVTYNPARVRAFVLSDDFVVATNFPNTVYGTAKISPIGVVSTTYKADIARKGIINSMDRTDVSIYIGGDFMKVNNHFTKNVARLNLNGTVLLKFKVAFDPGVVTQVDGFANAKALINTSVTLMRLKHDGTFDPAFTFTPFDGLSQVTKFIVQDDGRILVGAPSKIFRIHANGTKDTSFNSGIGGLTNGDYFDFDLDRLTGKIIFAGVFDGQPSYATRNVTRLNPNGSIDNTFTSQATFNLYGGVKRIKFLDNLEVMIMSIYTGDRQPTKLFADGSVDTEFIDNYNLSDAKFDLHERILRVGERTIMGAYSFYEQTLVVDSFYDDGHQDTGFSFPVSVGRFYDFYADNDREVFILGDISYHGASKPWQIAKVLMRTSGTTALAKADTNSDITFYPNPANNFIEIDNTDEAVVNIYSLIGESKIKVNVTSLHQQIDISNLSKGQYVIQINKNGRSYKQHLIKQ